MAEAVKNNVRRRRPPSHLREGYNEDNFEPTGSFYSSRAEPNKQNVDPCPMPLMARLLAKFLNSANRKLTQSKLKVPQQEMTPPPKKQAVQPSKYTIKQERIVKQERQAPSSRIQDNSLNRQAMSRQEPSKYQERAPRQITNFSPSPPPNTVKQSKNQQPTVESGMKNPFTGSSPHNIESMSKMCQQQLRRLIPKGFDSNSFKQQLIFPPDPNALKIMGAKYPQNLIKQSTRTAEFKPDTKLFKRASFHVGIAYNIHIENVRQRNPNFGPQQLDPTYVSKKLKQQNADKMRADWEQNQKLLVQKRQRQKQKQKLAQQNKKNKKKQQTMKNQTDESPNKIQNANKEPICIDLEQENIGEKNMQAKNIESVGQKIIQEFNVNEQKNVNQKQNKQIQQDKIQTQEKRQTHIEYTPQIQHPKNEGNLQQDKRQQQKNTEPKQQISDSNRKDFEQQHEP